MGDVVCKDGDRGEGDGKTQAGRGSSGIGQTIAPRDGQTSEWEKRKGM